MILVTGGGGFLGGAIIRQLLARGEQVRSLARGDYPALRELGVDVQRGDIADAAAVDRAVEGCSAVFHVAAKAGIWGAYEEFHSANVVGTANIIQACKKHGVQKLVYTSSPSVIDGGDPIEGIDESTPYPTEFGSAYSETKAKAEQMVLAEKELTTIAIRPPFIWGPGDNQLAPRMIDRASKGRVVRIGRRDNLIDATYIDNAAAAHLLALDVEGIAGKVYFISDDNPIPVHEMVNHMIGAAGYPPASRVIPTPLAFGVASMVEGTYKLLRMPQEPPLTRFLVSQLSKPRWFDISAAKQDLGYRPVVDLEEGLARMRESLKPQ